MAKDLIPWSLLCSVGLKSHTPFSYELLSTCKLAKLICYLLSHSQSGTPLLCRTHPSRWSESVTKEDKSYRVNAQLHTLPAPFSLWPPAMRVWSIAPSPRFLDNRQMSEEIMAELTPFETVIMGMGLCA